MLSYIKRRFSQRPLPLLPLPLLIPDVLLIRIVNDFLSFLDTRESGAHYYYSTVNKHWYTTMQRADKQLSNVSINIQNNLRSAVEIFSKNLNERFPRLHSVSVKKLTGFQATAFLCNELVRIPISVKVLQLESLQLLELLAFHSFTDFIIRNQHVATIHLNECFDDLTGDATAIALREAFTATHPLKTRIRVGEFVTIAASCSNMANDQNYCLRWVNQCPIDNCQEFFCWGTCLEDCNCEKRNPYPFVNKCCAKYKFTVPKICQTHLQQDFVQTPRGGYVCLDCSARPLKKPF